MTQHCRLILYNRGGEGLLRSTQWVLIYVKQTRLAFQDIVRGRNVLDKQLIHSFEIWIYTAVNIITLFLVSRVWNVAW